VIVLSGDLCENYRGSQNCWDTFSTVKVTYALILTKSGLGYILGGHPEIKSEAIC
jgi:hypothetical protein